MKKILYIIIFLFGISLFFNIYLLNNNKNNIKNDVSVNGNLKEINNNITSTGIINQGTGLIIKKISDNDLKVECKNIINLEKNTISVKIDKKILEKMYEINRAISVSTGTGENLLFYEAFNSGKNCSKIFNDNYMVNFCEVLINNNIDSYNYFKLYKNYETEEEKNKTLGILSKFLGNNEFKCDNICEDSYNEFIKLKENNILKKGDIFEKSLIDKSLLLINNNISQKELIDIGINKCVENYRLKDK